MSPVSGTVERPMQQAYSQAKEELSKSTEEAPPATDRPDTEDVETTSDEPAAQAPTTKGATASELDAEFAALEQQHIDNPLELAKGYKRAYTTKTQALAEDRKRLEALEPFADVIAALQEDVPTTLAQLAESYGLRVVPAESGKSDPSDAKSAAITTSVLDAFRAKLGTDYGYLADTLVPAIQELVDASIKGHVDTTVKPIATTLDRIAQRDAKATLERAYADFDTKHPGWKTHEHAMGEISEKFPPPVGRDGRPTMSEMEYLETVYTLATKDTAVAEGVKKAVAKMTKSAQATDRAESQPAQHVKNSPPHKPTLREAWDAAKRGDKWE